MTPSEVPVARLQQILHVDMDAFFVSVEELYNPELRGKPVVVGGPKDARGVVAAASYEARKYGIHSAMPLRTAGRLCPHGIFISGHYERYMEWSDKVRAIFERYTPVVDMVSIDEAYLDLTGTERLHGTAFEAAQKIQQHVWRETHLACSIGAATTHLVAKVASELAKPRGLLWVPTGAEASFLAPLPVRRIPGIGKKTEESLKALGVERVGELARIPADVLEELFGKWGTTLTRKAHGEDAELWFLEEEPKSIGNEHTFAEDVANPQRLEATLSYLAQKVGKRLRDAGLYARTITLKLRYADFKTITRAESLPEPTDLDSLIYATARRLFHTNWDRKMKVRLLGIQSSGLATHPEQASLLEGPERERREKLARAADRLRDRFGFDKVQLGRSLFLDEKE